MNDKHLNQNVTWIKTLVISTICTSTLSFIISIHLQLNSKNPLQHNIAFILNPYLNCFIQLILLFAFPSITYGVNKLEDKQLLANTNEPRHVVKNYGANNNYDPLIIDQIAQQACWNDPNLSFELFIETIRAEDAYLADWLKKQGKQYFNELFNRVKVKRASQLLREGSLQHYSLEAIGKMAGFSSRSNFYKWFKEVEGVTPNEYIKIFKN